MLELLNQIIKIRSTGLYGNNISDMTINLNKDYNKELSKKIMNYNSLVSQLHKDSDGFIYVNKDVINLLEDIMRIVLSNAGYLVKDNQILVNGDEIAEIIEISDLDRNTKDKYYYYFKAIIELACDVNGEAVLPRATVLSCIAYKGVFTTIRVERVLSDLVSANILDSTNIKVIRKNLLKELGVIEQEERVKHLILEDLSESEKLAKFADLAIRYIKDVVAPFVWDNLDGQTDFDKAAIFLKNRVGKDE